MGILQFVMLLFFILIYVGIVAALLARLTKRSLGIFNGDAGGEPQEVPMRG